MPFSCRSCFDGNINSFHDALLASVSLVTEVMEVMAFVSTLPYLHPRRHIRQSCDQQVVLPQTHTKSGGPHPHEEQPQRASDVIRTLSPIDTFFTQSVHLLFLCFSCLCSCLCLFPVFLTGQGDGVSGQLGQRLVVFGWAVHPDEMHESSSMIRTGLVGVKRPA
jgi:hypothetical protein